MDGQWYIPPVLRYRFRLRRPSLLPYIPSRDPVASGFLAVYRLIRFPSHDPLFIRVWNEGFRKSRYVREISRNSPSQGFEINRCTSAHHFKKNQGIPDLHVTLFIIVVGE